jgi:hypothetical protein
MEPSIKAYALIYTRCFLIGDPDLCRRIPSVQLDSLRAAEPDCKLTDWVAREEVTRILELIAASAPDEQTAHADIVRCGRAIGEQATSTFLKLLFKLLTPAMFARKLPDFWRRDHHEGYAEVERLETGHLVVDFKDIDGYTHAAPLIHGWVAYVLERVIPSPLGAVTCTPWSLAEPTASAVRFEARWP